MAITITEKVRTHVVLPNALVEEIDALVGKRKRSAFIKETVQLELRRRRQQEAFAQAKGSWKENTRFKTRKQTEQYIRSSRDASDDRPNTV